MSNLSFIVKQEPGLVADDLTLSASVARGSPKNKATKTEKTTVHKKTQVTKHASPSNSNGKKKIAVKEETCQAILLALCQRGGLRNQKGVSKKILAAAVDFKSIESKGFREPLKAVKDRGHVQVKADKVFLTEAGLAEVPGGAQAMEQKMTNAEQQKAIVDSVIVPGYKKGCGKMIEILSDGAYHTRLQVANAMGFSRIDSSGFKNCYKALKDHNYLEFQQQGVKKGGDGLMLRLSDDGFPEGRPCDLAVQKSGAEAN